MQAGRELTGRYRRVVLDHLRGELRQPNSRKESEVDMCLPRSLRAISAC